MKENDQITVVQTDNKGYLTIGETYTVQYTVMDPTFGLRVYVKEFAHTGSFPVGIFKEDIKRTKETLK